MSYIKLFPHRLALRTLTSVTDEATGYDMEYMLDTRKVTYWKSLNPTGNKDINIDLGSTQDINYVALYQKYGASIEVYYAGASDYSDMAFWAGATPVVGAWRLDVITDAAETARYWKIRFSSLSSAIRVALVFLGTSYEISVNFNYGDEIGVDYSGVKLLESKGGVRSAEAEALARNYWNVSWDILDETNKEKIDAVMALTNGAQYPLIFTDSDGVSHIGRIINKKLGAKRHHDAQYNIANFLIEEELGTPS